MSQAVHIREDDRGRNLADYWPLACPSMGNVLNVPLSTVTLTEDLAMIAMAGALLMM